MCNHRWALWTVEETQVYYYCWKCQQAKVVDQAEHIQIQRAWLVQQMLNSN